MAKFSAKTIEALDVIAHLSMASNLEKNVAGMKGFLEFYKSQMPPENKAILKKFDALCRSAYRNLA